MLRLSAVTSIALLVLSACGGGAAPSAAPAAPAASGAAGAAKEITIQSFALSPKTIEVPVGTKVTWTNKDGTQHTTTSGAPNAKDGKWDSGGMAQNATFSFTFAQAGTFTFFCSFHPTTAALQGTVTVK
jgi:plastocyanin